MKVTRIPHLDGDPGVTQTLGQMRRLIEHGKKDPEIHELAARILRSANVAPYDWEGEARAIFEWAKRNIRFTRDVYGHETLHAAADILRLGIADCDDFTVLICSLLQTIGSRCRIVTIATTPDGEFCHVYPEAEVNGRWIPLDCARREPFFGRAPERYTRKRVWSVDSAEFADMGAMRTNIAPGEGPIGAWKANVYPPFRVASRQNTGSYLNAWPVAPPHQQFKRPPIGLGNYGVPAARRALRDFSRGDLARTLGQDDGGGFDWSILTGGPGQPGLIQAATTGAANIISATRATPYNLFPTTSLNTGVRPGTITTPIASATFGGISTNTLLLGGAILLGAAVLAGRH